MNKWLGLVRGLLGVGDSIDWNDVWAPINMLLGSIGPYILGVIVVGTTVWGIYVASKFWAAGDDEEKLKKAKLLLKNTLFGVIIGGILIVALPLLISAIAAWAGMGVSKP